MAAGRKTHRLPPENSKRERERESRRRFGGGRYRRRGSRVGGGGLCGADSGSTSARTWRIAFDRTNRRPPPRLHGNNLNRDPCRWRTVGGLPAVRVQWRTRRSYAHICDNIQSLRDRRPLRNPFEFPEGGPQWHHSCGFNNENNVTNKIFGCCQCSSVRVIDTYIICWDIICQLNNCGLSEKISFGKSTTRKF